MGQTFSVQLFNVGCGEQLYVRLVAILKTSFEGHFQWHSLKELDLESQEDFFKTLEVSSSQIVLLIINRSELPHAGAFITGIKARKPDAEIIVISEECDAGEMFDLIKLGASDFIVPPINLSTIVPQILKLLTKAEDRQDTTQSLKAIIGMKLLVGQSPTFLAETRKIPLLGACSQVLRRQFMSLHRE